MEPLSDERLAALVKFVGENMSPKRVVFEDAYNALVELVGHRKIAEVKSKEAIILDKEYHGFESLIDIEQDAAIAISDACPSVLPPEFTGTVRVTITYYDAEKGDK